MPWDKWDSVGQVGFGGISGIPWDNWDSAAYVPVATKQSVGGAATPRNRPFPPVLLPATPGLLSINMARS